MPSTYKKTSPEAKKWIVDFIRERMTGKALDWPSIDARIQPYQRFANPLIWGVVKYLFSFVPLICFVDKTAQ
jgi:hypothetical protein